MGVRQKKLTGKAAITIPKDIRLEAGLVSGVAVDIEAVPDGVLIRRHRAVCSCCGADENIRRIKGKDVCKKCAYEIIEEVRKAYENENM